MEETAIQAGAQRLTSQATSICGDVGGDGDATSSTTPSGSRTAPSHGADFEPKVFASS